ncbi:Uncharacterised protein [Streptococcus pneumoniae]|nr:Uncharacterised protein [Streptococcus pneumoniae]CIW12435.1 Uncharacterised protein [Streptococcus pneumoniae]
MASDNLVLFFVDFLDIQKNQVSDSHEFVKLLKVTWFITERKSTGIQGTVDSLFLSLGEESNQEINLQESFSSTDCNPTLISPETTVAQGLCQDIIYRPFT